VVGVADGIEKHMLKCCLVLGLMMVLVGCMKPDPLAEEYAVYDALLSNTSRLDRIVPNAVPVIFDQTMPDELVYEHKDGTKRHWKFSEHVNTTWMPEFRSEILKDFAVKNETSFQLERRFKLHVDYKLLTQAEENHLFDESSGGWDAFYAQYPLSSGIIYLSRVGFNLARTQALVVINHPTHYLAGSGYMVWMVKEQGVWTVKESERYVQY
jgi:hypothetical protein